MDIAQAMGAMQNPQGTLMQYAIQGMIAQHPVEWQKCQQMFAGKNHRQQVNELRKLYKEHNMDLDATARQYGVQL